MPKGVPALHPELRGKARRRLTGGAKTQPRKIQAAEHRVEWLEMRRKGMTYKAIAEEYNAKHGTKFNKQAPYEAVMLYLRNLQAEALETAADIRTLELERLDALQAKFWDLALLGDMQAALFCLRVMESRRKLLGLDAERAKGEAPLVHVSVETPQAERVTLADVMPLLAGAGFKVIDAAGVEVTAPQLPAKTEP